MIQSSYRRFVSIFSLIVFLVSTVLPIQPAAFAAPEVSVALGENAASQIFFQQLPPKMGVVKDFYSPNSSDAPFVIHIQDAHVNPEAQTKIKELLHWIADRKESGEVFVGLEGLVGRLHPEYFEFSKKYPEMNQLIVDDLHKKGEVTGAELFAWDIFNKPAKRLVSFSGLEDASTYRKNLHAYRSLLYRETDVSVFLEPFSKDIHLLKSKILSKPLLEFFREKDRRKDGNFGDAQNQLRMGQLNVYVKFIAKKLKEKNGIDLEQSIEQIRFPNLVKLLVMERMAQQIDSNLAQKQTEMILNELKTKGRTQKDKLLFEAITNLSAAKEPREQLEHLWQFLTSHQLNPLNYEMFFKSAAPGVLRAEIEAVELFSELERAENILLDSMIKTPQEKELVQLMLALERIRRMVRLEITREEFSVVEGQLEKNSPSQVFARLQKLRNEAPKKAVDESLFNQALEFYQTAQKRDGILVDKLLGQVSKGEDVVLVSGGFHSEGIMQTLRDKGIGYVVIQPSFTEKSDPALLRKVFKDENADVSRYFQGQPFNKQVALFFREFMEVGIPFLFHQNAMGFDALSDIAAQTMSNHPVLASAIHVSASDHGQTKGTVLSVKSLAPVTKSTAAVVNEVNAVVFAQSTTGVTLFDDLVEEVSSSGTFSGSVDFTFTSNAAGLGIDVLSTATVSELPSSVTEPEVAVPAVAALGRSEVRSSAHYNAMLERTKELGLVYHTNQLATSPVGQPFRAADKSDLTAILSEISPAEKARLAGKALSKLANGKILFANSAAGAAQRMSVRELERPENAENPMFQDVLDMRNSIYGPGHAIAAKAGVPVGRDAQGNAYSYLGLELTNIQRLLEELDQKVPGSSAWKNGFLIMTNSLYQSEVDLELGQHASFHPQHMRFIQNNGRNGIQQDFGFHTYARVAHVKAYYAKVIADAKAKQASQEDVSRLEALSRRALEKAEAVEAEVRKGNGSATIYPNIESPEYGPYLGHAEFFHQMISKGLILDITGRDANNPNFEVISFRNIDNIAATFGEDWLVIMGLLLDKNLDLLAEVSLRKPRQKGGALIVTGDGNLRLTEDPSFDATIENVFKEFAARGFTRVPLDDQVRNTLRDEFSRTGVVKLEPSFMDINGTEIKTESGLGAFLAGATESEQRIAVFQKNDKLHFFRITRSIESAGFNHAVAGFTPGYILDIYRNPDQSRQEFLDELWGAWDSQRWDVLNAIADRGRKELPLLVDAKPANDADGNIVANFEGNMWQSTLAAKGSRTGAVGVNGLTDLPPAAEFLKLPAAEQAHYIEHGRFLGTKAWMPADVPETYAYNIPFVRLYIKYITEGHFIPADALASMGRSEVRHATTPSDFQGLRTAVGSTENLRSSVRRLPVDVNATGDVTGTTAFLGGILGDLAGLVSRLGVGVLRSLFLQEEGSQNGYLQAVKTADPQFGQAIDRQTATGIHTIAPITDAKMKDLPEGLIVHLATSMPGDLTTIVVGLSQADASQMLSKFTQRAAAEYGLPADVLDRIKIVGVGNTSVTAIFNAARVEVVADHSRIVGVLHPDAEILERQLAGLRRTPEVDGGPSVIYRLVDDGLGFGTAVNISGVALRNPIPDQYELRLSRVMKRFGLTGFASRMSAILAGVKAFATAA